MGEIKPDVVVDARGELCPMPVVKVKLAIEEMGKGQVLQLLATDPGSRSDMAYWAEATGHTILEAKEEKGLFTYLVQKS